MEDKPTFIPCIRDASIPSFWLYINPVSFTSSHKGIQVCHFICSIYIESELLLNVERKREKKALFVSLSLTLILPISEAAGYYYY